MGRAGCVRRRGWGLPRRPRPRPFAAGIPAAGLSQGPPPCTGAQQQVGAARVVARAGINPLLPQWRGVPPCPCPSRRGAGLGQLPGLSAAPCGAGSVPAQTPLRGSEHPHRRSCCPAAMGTHTPRVPAGFNCGMVPGLERGFGQVLGQPVKRCWVISSARTRLTPAESPAPGLEEPGCRL